MTVKIDHILFESEGKTHKIYHYELQEFLNSKDLVLDTCVNGEHVQTPIEIDYIDLLNDEENLSLALKDFLNESV